MLFGLALLVSLLSFRGDGARAAYFRQRLAFRLPDAGCPKATVIVPVKGFDQGLRENLAALASQDYPDFELIVVAREASDIALADIPANARLVIAGPGEADTTTSHKITNLLAAVGAARAESQIFAFADSDGRPGPKWLRSLAAELRHPTVGAATGYRWYVLDEISAADDDGSQLRAVWNAAIAGTFGPGDAPFCWGGAMAITRANFERCQVRRFWLGQISDDFELARAIHAAGLQVAFAPGAVVPCPDRTTVREFFSWAARQMILTRVYAPKLWWQALVAHIIYVSAILMVFSEHHLVPLLVIGLGAWKAVRRARLFHLAIPGFEVRADMHGWIVTLATFVWLGVLLASAFTRTIVWRGVRYRLAKPV